jgi:hypothetical protein
MTVDNIGRQVAAANTALDENQVAGIIFAGLFETGPHRTTSAMKYVALQGIKAALVEWKKQLLAAAGRDVDKYKLGPRRRQARAGRAEAQGRHLEERGQGLAEVHCNCFND